MTSRHNTAIVKLELVRDYITEKLPEDIPIGSDAAVILNKSLNLYNTLINNLIAALSAYKNNHGQKAPQLRTIIMGLLQNGLMSSFTSDDFVTMPVTGSFLGSEDVSAVYSCNGVYDVLSSTNISAFYNGPVDEAFEIDLGDETLYSEYLLASVLKNAEGAEAAEVIKRNSLAQWLNTFSTHNMFMILFESPTNANMTATPRSLAEGIYINNKVKSVIDEYGLDVYIPTYLR